MMKTTAMEVIAQSGQIAHPLTHLETITAATRIAANNIIIEIIPHLPAIQRSQMVNFGLMIINSFTQNNHIPYCQGGVEKPPTNHLLIMERKIRRLESRRY
jgi:hypothetical protein